MNVRRIRLAACDCKSHPKGLLVRIQSHSQRKGYKMLNLYALIAIVATAIMIVIINRIINNITINFEFIATVILTLCGLYTLYIAFFFYQ